jgi:hypothetical protein
MFIYKLITVYDRHYQKNVKRSFTEVGIGGYDMPVMRPNITLTDIL